MADLLILSIETSTGCGSVALTSGTLHEGHVVAELTLRPPVTHSRKLLSSVRYIMNAVGITWDELDGIAVSHGPGSFTGLRIGMAAAKGLAMGSGMPVTGVASLDGLAAQCVSIEQQICCILDARKGQVYSALYQFDQQKQNAERIGQIRVLKPEELAASITDSTLLVGPGVAPYEDFFRSQEQFYVLPEALVQPKASYIGFIGAAQLSIGRRDLAENVNPVYIRASEAEINAEKKS